MTASALYILAALILIAPHTSEFVAKSGCVFMLALSRIAFAIENAR